MKKKSKNWRIKRERKRQKKETEEGDGRERKRRERCKKVPVEFATGSSSRSPSPDCQTPRFVSACARYGTDSWPSEIPLNIRNTPQREHTDLEIQLPEVIEEHFDPVVVLGLMQDNELHIYFS